MTDTQLPNIYDLRLAAATLRDAGVRLETETPNAFGLGTAYREQLDRVADWLDWLTGPAESAPICKICGHATVDNCKTVESFLTCRFAPAGVRELER